MLMSLLDWVVSKGREDGWDSDSHFDDCFTFCASRFPTSNFAHITQDAFAMLLAQL